jgi:hypothetical protein
LFKSTPFTCCWPDAVFKLSPAADAPIDDWAQLFKLDLNELCGGLTSALLVSWFGAGLLGWEASEFGELVLFLASLFLKYSESTTVHTPDVPVLILVKHFCPLKVFLTAL